MQFYGQSKTNAFEPPRAFWFLTQCCLQTVWFSLYARKVKNPPPQSYAAFCFFFFFITIRQTDLEEEATLYSHPKYPPEDTFIISFSKRIVQKLDLILYTVEELSLRFNFPTPSAPHPPSWKLSRKNWTFKHVARAEWNWEIKFYQLESFLDRSPMRNSCGSFVQPYPPNLLPKKWATL